MANPDFNYAGPELELFRDAHHWKKYYGRCIRDFLGHSVLEVGAGLGGTTNFLCRDDHQSWVCLEPDKGLCDQILRRIEQSELPGFCSAVNGSLKDISRDQLFDTVLYIDVLEHIQEDREELQQAAALVCSGGHLVVLAPAHNWLFSDFDEAIGHYRRYSATTLREISPAGTEVVLERYLDSCGTCLSLLNRLLLRQSIPSKRAIKLWDKVFVPLSTVVDRLLRYKFGKTIVMAWRKPQVHVEHPDFIDNKTT